ncbi:hypothetical protein [Methylomagnum ishizawai]|uniref:hypothetical protein n=1 Tax=Methylomagnum ishizawai TaxID=1760988 RepID=UPI001C821D5B|nr:hypothetical protein [Methylomagnum ishizawai]
MTPNRPLPSLLAGLLLAVPLAQAQEYRHPSGFEPKPVFEDEAPARKPYPAQPPTPAAAPPTPASPPPVAKAAENPRQPAALAGHPTPPPTETLREPGQGHHDPSHARPTPLVEDEIPARKPYPPQPVPAAAAPAPALSQPKAPTTTAPQASAKPDQAPKRYAVASARPDEPPKRRPVAPVQPDEPPAPALEPAPAVPAPSANPLVEYYPFGLIALALAGWVAWNIRSAARDSEAGPKDHPAVPANPSGPTGVARYLSRLEATAKAEQGTGVARYLSRLAAGTKPADS